MLRVGLTGGIGAGKSSVAGRLDQLGAALVDADTIAREVVESGTPGLAAVVAEFGDDVLAADGSLDRSRLGRIVFGDERRRQALNGIVHPLVYRRRQQLVDEAGADAVVVEDIPLLVENGLEAAYHLVVVVHAPEDERVRRLVTNRDLTEEDVRARIRAQVSDDERRAAADVVIDNSGTPARTEAAVDELWKQRLVPFEANLRTGSAAPRSSRAVIADPDPTWERQAGRIVARLRRMAGERALRIDHIGSTSVPGLAAKDVIDVQIVVADLESASQMARDVADAGLVGMPGRWWDTGRDGTEWDKRMACNADPARAVNCHVRPQSSPSGRDAVLLRDWLRASPADVAEYAELKRRLAAQPHDTIEEYADAKTPWVNEALARAEAWATSQRWAP